MGWLSDVPWGALPCKDVFAGLSDPAPLPVPVPHGCVVLSC